MDPDITNLVQKIDFASIPKSKGLSNTEKSLNHHSTRLKYGATSQGNVNSDSNLTIDLKQLVIINEMLETEESFMYLEDTKSVHTVESNKSSAQWVRPSAIKGEQGICAMMIM